MHIRDLLELEAGPNASRIRSAYTEMQMYTVADLEADLAQIKYDAPAKAAVQAELVTSVDDLIVSLIRQEAAIVTKAHAGKVLNSNFVKCRYDSARLDPWFLCYWLNESDEVKGQNYRQSKLTAYIPSSLAKLKITLPAMNRQKEIGRNYKALKHLQYLMDRQKDAWTKLTLQTLRKNLEEEK